MIAASCVLSLLGLVSIAIWTIDLLSDDSASRWVGAALGVGYGSLRSLFTPLYTLALIILPAALRRDARRRELAFQFALLTALLLGFMALFVSVLAVVQHRIDAGFAGSVVAFGLAVVLAWSLSRPSAKAWFRPPPAA